MGFRSGHCGSPWTGALRPLEADGFSPAPSRIPLTQAILLRGQQPGLNPAAQHELLVARKLVQLRDQIDRQVLQFRQKVVAVGQVNLLKKFRRYAGWFLI